MNRSGYSDYSNNDCDNWQMICWSGAVKSAMRGKRGQAFLRELVDVLDAMPVKSLIAKELQDEHGAVCALGSVGASRGIDMSKVDPEDWDSVASAFSITPALAREIMYHNDEGYFTESPEKRWQKMRKWAEGNIITDSPASPGGNVASRLQSEG